MSASSSARKQIICPSLQASDFSVGVCIVTEKAAEAERARDALKRTFVAARSAAIAVGALPRRHRLALALVCIVAAGLARAARKSATASVSVPAAGARTVTACDYTVTEGGVRVESGARDAADAAAAACSVTVAASASPAPTAYPDGPLKVLNDQDQLYAAAYTAAFGVKPDSSVTPPLVLAEIDATYSLFDENGFMRLTPPPSHTPLPSSFRQHRWPRSASRKRRGG